MTTPTFKESMKRINDRIILDNMTPSDEDIEEFKSYTEEEIFSIRKTIEQNHEYLINPSTGDKIKFIIQGYAKEINFQLSKFQLYEDMSTKDFKNNPQNSQSKYILDVYEDCNTHEFISEIHDANRELQTLLRDYFPIYTESKSKSKLGYGIDCTLIAYNYLHLYQGFGIITDDYLEEIKRNYDSKYTLKELRNMLWQYSRAQERMDYFTKRDPLSRKEMLQNILIKLSATKITFAAIESELNIKF